MAKVNIQMKNVLSEAASILPFNIAASCLLALDCFTVE
jgi:hypothetical protein